jgi:signal transduction histidine kinase
MGEGTERGLRDLNHLVQALSRSSQAMTRARDETEYLREVCRIVVENCGYFLVWIGYKVLDPSRSVKSMAWSGFDESYLTTLRLTWSDEERGQGPTGTAIRTGRASLCRFMATDPRFAPWRRMALARGYASCLALPLLNKGEAFGAMTVYSPRPDAFSPAQERVLGELAEDLAHGILMLRLRESESRAQGAFRESALNLQRLNNELEGRVQERTAELVRANEALTVRLLDRDKALEALEQSEEKFRHAQKLEAIGILAGGIAHDFNNLLQVIYGYSELALEGLEAGHPLREDLEAIQRAGQKGAALTRQLLAFSRRQALAAEILDLNSVFREMETFCLRVVPPGVHLVLDLERDLGAVEADRSQLEQVFMNLVVNARDAMPEGGTLRLETRNQGPYVTFSVTDTGEGMTEEVRARIFEPFFTTKGVGKGTGLGLSTVLGIVEQSGGKMEVRSQPGFGSTFTVSLPRTLAQAKPKPPPAEPVLAPATETLLLVEDDWSYKVMTAGEGASALELLRDHPGPVHLLLTDLVMPGLNGWELALKVRALRPEIRVVFMSAYPDAAFAEAGEAMGDRVLIPKPFDRATLLAVVRKALK